MGPSWPYRGGISRTTTRLAQALELRGSLAAFLVAARQYPAFLYPGQRDIDPEACPRLGVAEPSFGVLEPVSWRRLARRLRGARAEAVVLPYWTWVWAGMGLYLATAKLPPLVGIVHNPADHDARWWARTAARAVLGRCRGFLCHAGSVEQRLRRDFPSIPVAVHPLPPERPARLDRETARRGLGVPAEAVALLCFGLIRPYKGVDVLLEAVRSLPPGTPAMLLLAGEPWGALREEVARTLADPALAGRVIARLEWVPEGEVETWLGAADLMVLPYRSATGSAVAAQALGCGLPVVASRVGGLAEVVEDEVNGLLVPPGDAPALAAALRRVCEATLLARLTAGARQLAARWSWGSYAQALEDLVAAVLAGGGPGGAGASGQPPS